MTTKPKPLTVEEEAQMREKTTPGEGMWSFDEVRRLFATIDAEREKRENAERELGELKAALREGAHLSLGETSVKDILRFAAGLDNQSAFLQPRFDAAKLLLAVLEPGEGE